MRTQVFVIMMSRYSQESLKGHKSPVGEVARVRM